MLSKNKKERLFPVMVVVSMILATYSVAMSFITFDLALRNRLGSETSSNAEQPRKVMVTLLFESQVEDAPLNVTYVVTADVNQTLESLLRETLGSNLKGRYYQGMGFYVTSIFGLEEKNNGTGWVYQEFDVSTGQWVSPSVGVTFFVITRSIALRFIFLP